MVENRLQTHEIASFFKFSWGGAFPQTPPATASSFAACILKILVILKLPPPLRNPAYTPGYMYLRHAYYSCILVSDV